MADVAIELQHVYKKFKKGEIYDSLRDLIPALTGRLLRSQKSAALENREFWAVNDVSFQVTRGEAFGIIGPNGSGKSTILKLLSGILKPTRGAMIVNGKLSALIEVGAGFHQDLTGRENIFLNATILGMKRSEIVRKFDEIVDFSGLAEFIDTPIKRYSTGMYARLGFAVAAHIDPDILLVDEVLSVGDLLFQKKCMQKMMSIMKSGASVIFVSHNLKAVSDLCDRSLLLTRGRPVQVGPTDEVIRAYLNQSLMSDHQQINSDVRISRVTIRDETAERAQFKAGQKAWLEVELHAAKKCDKLSIVLYLQDEHFYDIFITSTEPLGYEAFSLDAGETRAFTFELDLNLGSGTFRFGVRLYRYDIAKIYDDRFPAATIVIGSTHGILGATNLYPKLVKM